jgi:crotonobetainyl-CoA:carnitine CoA-transferase CaiB-like acyl-CoA transferase
MNVNGFSSVNLSPLQENLAQDERFSRDAKRNQNKESLRSIILDIFSKLTVKQVTDRLEQARIANCP